MPIAATLNQAHTRWWFGGLTSLPAKLIYIALFITQMQRPNLQTSVLGANINAFIKQTIQKDIFVEVLHLKELFIKIIKRINLER